MRGREKREEKEELGMDRNHSKSKSRMKNEK